MLWFILSFSVAVLRAIRDLVSKNFLKSIDEYTLAFGLRFFTFAFSLPLLIITGIPRTEPGFIYIIIAYSMIIAAATVLLMKAIKYSDISLAMPLLSLSPAFMLLSSSFIVNEFPPPLGIVGIFVSIAGSYLLNFKSGKHRLLEPFKMIVKERGARYALFVALLWSVSANLDKAGTMSSSPIFWVCSSNLATSMVILPFTNFKEFRKMGFKGLTPLTSLGALTVASLTMQMYAMTLVFASYVIAIKRLSVVIDVFLGHFLLGERGFGERALGAAVMFTGIIILIFS